MTQITIRKSGGTNIVSLPKAVLSTLGLHTDSILELTLKNRQIILTPVNDELTLEDVLKGSPKKRLAAQPEDDEWDNIGHTGKEEW